MKKSIFTSIILLMSFNFVQAQEEIRLYPEGVSESNEIMAPERMERSDFVVNITDPRMYAYLVAGKKNPAVLICPGGGYVGVSVIKEGKEIAEWFNKIGISAFVLYYRMPNGHDKIPLKDAQTALEIIHQKAKAWNIDAKKIGIMGFSAGGHLAATAGTHFTAKDNRPAFMILGYPVITMQQDFTHAGSRRNLLGESPDDALVTLYSNELQVTPKTPPAFIFHARDDKTVPVKNSAEIADALNKNGVPVEFHTFAAGGHGFGMRPVNPETDTWPVLLEQWLKSMNFLNCKLSNRK